MVSVFMLHGLGEKNNAISVCIPNPAFSFFSSDGPVIQAFVEVTLSWTWPQIALAGGTGSLSYHNVTINGTCSQSNFDLVAIRFSIRKGHLMVMSPDRRLPDWLDLCRHYKWLQLQILPIGHFYFVNKVTSTPLSTNVIEPVWSFVNVLHPNNGSATLMPLSRISSLSCGPKADLYKVYVPAASAGEATLNTIVLRIERYTHDRQGKREGKLVKIVKLFHHNRSFKIDVKYRLRMPKILLLYLTNMSFKH